MEFQQHLFISYAHNDNRPLPGQETGWISCFHETLSNYLTTRLGRKAVIWFDQTLRGNDEFASVIVSQFPKTAILVSIVSESYLNSDWCKREVEEFCKASGNCRLTVGNKNRVLKVIKTPVDRHTLPEVMQTTLGYEFFNLDGDVPLELYPVGDMAQKYNGKVAKLAWEIKEVLKALAAAEPAPNAVEFTTSDAAAAPNPSGAAEKPAVYLAECGYDQRESREMLETELKCHGYRVLPDSELPSDEVSYSAKVTELLNQSQLSIHLVGSLYGWVPKGPSEKSVVVLQNELATQCSREHGLPRIIWLPDDITPKHEELKSFILRLQNDADAQYGADLITSSERETLKTTVHAALARLREKQANAAAHASQANDKFVYIICDPRDRQNTIPVRKLFRSRNIQAKIPVFEGDAATVRQANEELLKRCDAVVIFYGEGGAAWKVSNELEVTKMRGGLPPVPVWIYLTGPQTEDKQDIMDLEEPYVLNCLQGFSETTITPLVEAMEGRRS